MVPSASSSVSPEGAGWRLSCSRAASGLRSLAMTSTTTGRSRSAVSSGSSTGTGTAGGGGPDGLGSVTVTVTVADGQAVGLATPVTSPQ
jgi:hypothetical protein